MSMFNRVMNRVGLFGKTTEADNVVTVPGISANLPLLCDSKGVLFTRTIASGTGESGDILTVASDALVAVDGNGLLVSGASLGYDGSVSNTYSRWRNNNEETILASAARTATTNSADFTNFNHKGGHFIIDISAITATPSITVIIQGKDPVSSNYYDILVSDALVAVGTNTLKVYPGIGQIANQAASDILPRTFRVSVTHADADSITYSISYQSVV